MNNESVSFTPSELRSGFLVTSAAIVLFVLLFMTGNAEFFKDTRQIKVFFHYIGGLEKNAPVHFAGHRVGRVTAIELSHQSETQMAVTVTVSKDVVLKKDSEAFIDILGFMGEKLIELTPGSAESPSLGENEPIQGTDPIVMAALVKEGADLMEDFRRINDSLKSLVAQLDTMLNENRPELDGIIQNLNESSANLKEMTHDLKLHPWKLLKKGKEANSNERKRRFFFF